MRCEDFEIRISAYLDKELTFQEMRNFERHMVACPLCGATLTGVEQVRMSLSNLGTASAPASFRFRLCVDLHQATTRQRSRWINSLALMLAFGAALAILLFPESNQDDELTVRQQTVEQNIQVLDWQPGNPWRGDFSGASRSYSHSHAQAQLFSY